MRGSLLQRRLLVLLAGTLLAVALHGQQAMVSFYDNYISFGELSPLDGRETPVTVVAQGHPAAYSIDGISTLYDVAGVQIKTTKRLGLTIAFSGNLARAAADLAAFPAEDSRKAAGGKYELLTEYKINLHGAFYHQIGPFDAGPPYISPTSGMPTEFNRWTGWSPSGSGNSSLLADEGWLSPTATDAWTGEEIMDRDVMPNIGLIVERHQGDTGAEPAEVWIAERITRRGLQDVSGNYRQDVHLQLYFAE